MIQDKITVPVKGPPYFVYLPDPETAAIIKKIAFNPSEPLNPVEYTPDQGNTRFRLGRDIIEVPSKGIEIYVNIAHGDCPIVKALEQLKGCSKVFTNPFIGIKNWEAIGFKSLTRFYDHLRTPGNAGRTVITPAFYELIDA